MMSRLEAIMERVDGMKQDVLKQIEREVVNIVEVAVDRRLEEKVKDKDDKRKRECNLVIHGLVEGGEEDESKCKMLFEQELELEDVKIERVVRLKNGNRGRDEEARAAPLLVSMSTGGQKWAVISRAKKLKNAKEEQNKRVMIVPDLSVKEREEDRKLREELRRRREGGENNLYISKGQIKRRMGF